MLYGDGYEDQDQGHRGGHHRHEHRHDHDHGRGGNVQPTFSLLAGISSTDPESGSLIPPDNGLAANSGYIVQDVNAAIRWTDITGANPVEQSFATFFAPQGSYSFVFDPRVIYNDATSQFVVSVAATDPANGNHILLGVSNDSNPNDGFAFHDYQFTGSPSIDQPSLAADGSTLFIQATVGYPVEMQHLLVIGGDGQGPAQEVDLGAGGIYKQVAAQGTGDYALAQDNGTLTLDHLTTAGVIDATGSVSLGNISSEYGEQYLPTQGETQPIDAGDSRVYGLALGNGKLWTTFEVTPPSGPDAGTPNVHWAELNVSDPSDIAVIDQGSLSGSVIGPGVGTATGSVGIDKAGDVVLNFVASGPDLVPTDYFEVKAVGQPTFSSPIAWDSSAGPYLVPGGQMFGSEVISRWGDYSSAIPDPNNPHAFYISNEIGITPGSFGWSTPIAHVVVPPSYTV